jgi:hypothetical protein
MNRIVRSEAKLTAAGILRALALAFILLMSSHGDDALAFSSGPLDELTNAPAFGGGTESNCTLCHNSLALNSGVGGFTIVAPVTYEPGMNYDITVSLSHPVQTRWGFELTAIDAALIGVGELIAGSDGLSQVTSTGTRDYAKQTTLGSAAGQTVGQTWTFNWTAPPTDAGTITLYAAGVAADNSSSPTGDEVYTNSATIAVPEPSILMSQLAAGFTVAGIAVVRRRLH